MCILALGSAHAHAVLAHAPHIYPECGLCVYVCVCTALRVLSQRVPDLDALAGRLLRRHASLLDLVKVYNLVRVLPSVVSTLKVR
jgi:hypothetical protein